MSSISLTNYSQAGGCGCKIDPGFLSEILKSIKQELKDSHLIVGFENSDDSAVYDYGTSDYLLFTTDFFTPLVDDPFTYGVIAAANAISDIYAMGGKPLIANTILGFPRGDIPKEIIQEIIRGGTQTLNEANCFIAGGHTIINPQPFYGFSILGKVPKINLKKNTGARLGDLLILTKPLGVGIYSNAIKLGLLPKHLYEIFLPLITRLNKEGEELGKITGVHALTDVTGFGLIGHIQEMIGKSGLSAHIRLEDIPLLPETNALACAVLSPLSGAMRNFDVYRSYVEYSQSLSQEYLLPLFDPQSNGGLLIAASKDTASKVLSIVGNNAKVIGYFDRKATSDFNIYLE